MYPATGNISSHLPESSSAAARNPTILYPFRHHQADHPTMIPISHHPIPPPYTPSGGDDDDDDEFPRRDERFPQWGNQETRDLIEIKAQLELGFAAPINLWEVIANRMREKGYRRTADQCKYKWQNLVSTYKGGEASDADNVQPCPFFNELHALFMMRANKMQAGSVVQGNKRLKSVCEEEFTKEEEEEITVVPKRKDGRDKRQTMGENGGGDVLKGMMRNFMAQQERIDMQWRETMEKKAEEREAFEEEWRQKMERLERERLMMERAWREREEQRRLREENRAEKRDALLSSLLNKLIHDQSP